MKTERQINLRARNLRRVAWLGLLVNLSLAALKIAAGWLGRSRAVLADGVHSLSDLATDIGVLFCAHYCTEPADRGHPYGHGRIDVLVSLAIALLMALAGVGLLVSSIDDLRSGTQSQPGLIALLAAAISLVSKEILFRWTRKASRRLKSPSLQANAAHHRSDAFSSIPVLIAVAVARHFPSWQFLDSVGGMAVSVLVGKMAWDIGRRAVRDLSDASAPAATIAEIIRLATAIKGVCEVHRVRTRWLGGGWSVDLHVLVDGAISVRVGHDIADLVKQRLLESGSDIADVVVHIEPAAQGDGMAG